MLGDLISWDHILIAAFFLLVPLVLWIIALIQIAASKAAAGPIVAWIVLTTLIPWIGAILWFTIGRKSLRAVPSPAS
jgi:Phospholipase_D-nuclease N-terminal